MAKGAKRSEGSGAEEARGGRGLLRPAILLLLTEHESHGYELVSRLGELGFEVSDLGGLYRTLRTMEDEGLVTSSWGTPSRGPARRVYGITPEGEQQLRESTPGLVSQRRAIGEVLERYRKLVRTGRRRPRAGRRALVIDDDDDIRHTLWVLLEQQGWQVEEAPDGETALSRSGATQHDVVVLDYRMPGMSGLEVAQRLRESDYEGPIVLYSAYLSPPLEDEAAVLGLETLAKADSDQLLEVIGRVSRPGRAAPPR